jgi:hypothetical protein
LLTARAALERLPANEAVFISNVQAELHLFLAFCAARVRRFVAANLSLSELLLPGPFATPS